MNRIGIDPGLEKSGFAILNKNNQILRIGIVETKKEDEIQKRLKLIYQTFYALIDEYQIELILIEKIISTKSILTNIEKILQARGCILTLAGIKNLNVIEIHPKTVKKIITGYGNANKKSIQRALEKVYGYSFKGEILTDDGYDALAIALSYP